MNWKQQLQDGSVQQHTPTKREIADLRGVVRRNLADAALFRLSADNRLGIAYEAVLVSCKIAVHASGYRVRSTIPGAHAKTLECAQIAIGPAVSTIITYFDAVRRKRNRLSYDVAGTVSDTEAEEALKHARGFQSTVDAWLARHHPGLA